MASASRAEGCYVAFHTPSRTQVSQDRFAIRTRPEGLRIEAHHLPFGPKGVPSRSLFVVDPDWTPRRVEVVCESLTTSLTVEFDEEVARATMRNGPGVVEQQFPMARRRAWFSALGALYFPLHLVRRFDFADPGTQSFSVFPHGRIDLVQRPDVTKGERAFRCLEARLDAGGATETLDVLVDERDDLVSYRIRGQGVEVRLDE